MRFFVLHKDGKIWQNPDVNLPVRGQVIMIRLPFVDIGPVSDISNSALSEANRENYHPCILVDARHSLGDTHWVSKLLLTRSFSFLTNKGIDPATFISTLTAQEINMPLPAPPPPGVAPAPTPAGFGTPLQVHRGGFKLQSWVKAKVEKFHVQPGMAVSQAY